MTFTIDTREPWPHPYAEHFSSDVKLRREGLETGDLCVGALPDGVVVERKAVSDLYGCLGKERERFERELQRSRYLGRLIVVVEGNMSDLITLAHQRGSLLGINSIIGTLAAWQRRYCPFFFAGSVKTAAEFTERLLRGQVKDIERSAKILSKTETNPQKTPTT